MQNMQNIFEQLQQSNRDLLTRFDVQPTVNLCLRLVNEEVRELKDAVEYEPIENVAEEAADVLVVLAQLLDATGAIDHLPAAIERVIEKNHAKTHETHHVNQYGKIQRND